MSTKSKKRQLRLIPLECYREPVVEPCLIPPGPPRLQLVRRVPQTFTVEPVIKGENYWLVGLLNDNTSLEYRQDYVLLVPKKSKKPDWAPQELAIACARRLSEYRGWVWLQRFLDNTVVFAAGFASNSMWTFCVWSTDQERCPLVNPCPTVPLASLPLSKCEPHHSAPKSRDPNFCKTAQRMFP